MHDLIGIIAWKRLVKFAIVMGAYISDLQFYWALIIGELIVG